MRPCAAAYDALHPKLISVEFMPKVAHALSLGLSFQPLVESHETPAGTTTSVENGR